jgi:hypothetical protein
MHEACPMRGDANCLVRLSLAVTSVLVEAAMATPGLSMATFRLGACLDEPASQRYFAQTAISSSALRPMSGTRASGAG